MAKNINNYFTTMISRYNNEDFVPLIKPEQIQRSAKERIFREMVRGQIDYTVHGKYFQDNKFLENLLVAANDEYNNCVAISNALSFYDIHCPGQIGVVRNNIKYANLVSIYYILYNKLYSIKVDGNIGVLTDIPYVLKEYSKFM